MSVISNICSKLSCFKAYDIRGKVPNELDEELSFAIGQAFSAKITPQQVVVGHDIRLSSEAISNALINGLVSSGVDVVDIGLCGTEEVYFVTAHLGVDGGIMITASHNPSDYNGMKLVSRDARPISGDTGLNDIKKMVQDGFSSKSKVRGTITPRTIREQYIDHLLSYIDVSFLKPLTLVVNPGNGCAGPVIDLLESRLPFKLIKIQYEPDGNFPNGVPNPLLPENRNATSEAIIKHKADMGIAWDGDFDRCFLFDEKGDFVEGYYLVGLLAKALLKNNPGAKIIHDPRLVWNTREIVKSSGGQPVMSKTGHAFIKERMRAEDAVYGGEMSAHHYFREFSYCDSGMIPWLLVSELLSGTDKKLSEIFHEMKVAYPVSGEINSRVEDPDKVIAQMEKLFAKEAQEIDYTDGLSMNFDQYRFNVRKSNTEPLLRLNVESRGNRALMEQKTHELLRIIKG